MRDKIQPVLGEAVAGTVGSMAAVTAYAVRARSSSLLGPSIYRGCRARPAIALTFDDGPSEGTSEILSVLRKYQAPATFFQCGANVRRIPAIARDIVAEGHEIGNHTQTHPYLCFHSTRSITEQFHQAQSTIEDLLGVSPLFLRAPYGVRWLGIREAQRKLKLLGVMWTTIGKDWKLPADRIATRLLRGACNGAIFCLHDGRELHTHPDTSSTVEALRITLPQLRDRGFQFETVTRILCPKN